MPIDGILVVIGEHMSVDEDRLAQAVGRHILEILDTHTIWTGACRGGANHWDDALPCEDFEHALALGLTWLTGKVGLDIQSPVEAPAEGSSPEPPVANGQPRARGGRKVTTDQGA